MATLYVASTETFVGKSAVCIGLLQRMQRDSLRIGYMKPVSVSVKRTEEQALDEDAAFIKQTLNLDESLEQLTPALVTPSAIESLLRGKTSDFGRRVQDAYLAVSRDKDIVVLEGTNSWSEGTLVELSADQVSDQLAAPVLLVLRYRTTLAVDTALAVQRFLGERLLGVLINQVEEPQHDFVTTRVVPFLEGRGVPVFGVLPQDQQLASMSVGDLADHLGGQVIGRPQWRERAVDALMVGAMGSESALSLFRRKANKAVFTGGDRSDLQAVALETSTSMLVLTGNIRPSTTVLDLADERGCTVVLVPDDTMTALDRAEEIFGRVRFHQAGKIERFTALLDKHLDYPRLYEALGLKV